MNKNTKRIGSIVGSVVLTIGVVIALIWGISTHKEAGLIPGVPQWQSSDFPLAVAAEGYTSEGSASLRTTQIATLASVIHTVNQRLGFSAFAYSTGSSPRVRVLLGVPPGIGWRDHSGDSRLVLSGSTISRCEVRTSNIPTDRLLWQVIYHELGHCLGLAHDHYRSSVMYSETIPVEEGLLPGFSDSDRKLLRQSYYREN